MQNLPQNPQQIICEYQCNNPKCSQFLLPKTPAYVAPCFHAFCQNCAKQISTSCCPVCGLAGPRLKQISLSPIHSGTEMKLLGTGIEETMNSCYTAVKFFMMQKETEIKQIITKIDNYRNAALQVQKESEEIKKETKNIKETIEKLIEENKKLFTKAKSVNKAGNTFQRGMKKIPQKTTSVFTKPQPKLKENEEGNFFLQKSIDFKTKSTLENNFENNSSFGVLKTIPINRYESDKRFITPTSTTNGLCNNERMLQIKLISGGGSMKSEFINHSGKQQ